MPETPRSLHPLFRLAALAVGIFIITVFAMIATVFGDPRAPVAVFFNKHGGSLIGAEVVMTLTLSFLAMAADRRRTRQEMEEQAFARMERSAEDEDKDGKQAITDPEERHVRRDQERD